MSVAGWHQVEGDNERVRYWDGTAWTDRYRPLTVHLSLTQAENSARIADDVRVIRGWVTFMGVLLIIGLVLGFLAGLGVLGSAQN